MQNKKVFLIILMVILIIIAITCMIICFKNKQGDTENLNNTEVIIPNSGDESGDDELIINEVKLDPPKSIDGVIQYKNLTITNIEAQMMNRNECEIRAVVTNNMNEMSEVENIKITTYDADGNVLDVFGAQINSILPNDKTKLYALVRRTEIESIVKVEIDENK